MDIDWTALQERLTTASTRFLEMCVQLDSSFSEQKNVAGEWSAKDWIDTLPEEIEPIQ